MLQAVISSKAGRFPVANGEESVSWRKAFRISEDLLTASVFRDIGREQHRAR